MVKVELRIRTTPGNHVSSKRHFIIKVYSSNSEQNIFKILSKSCSGFGANSSQDYERILLRVLSELIRLRILNYSCSEYYANGAQDFDRILLKFLINPDPDSEQIMFRILKKPCLDFLENPAQEYEHIIERILLKIQG